MGGVSQQSPTQGWSPFCSKVLFESQVPQKVNRDRICIFLLNALRVNCETVSRILQGLTPAAPHIQKVFLPHAAGAASAAQGGARESAWALYPVPCPWMWPLGLHLLSSCVPYSCAKCSLQNPPGPLPAGLPPIPLPHTLPCSLHVDPLAVLQICQALRALCLCTNSSSCL